LTKVFFPLPHTLDLRIGKDCSHTLRVAEAKKTPKNYYSPAISRVIDYIYHGKNKTLTLNQLASLVNLTPKYLSALFHIETGQTLTVLSIKFLSKRQRICWHILTTVWAKSVLT
jgi:YesN/AraC family two-component response regulator